MRGSAAWLALGAVTVYAAATAPSVAAFEKYVAKIPNGNAVPGIQALGHVNHSGGGARNSFGRAFERARFRWTQELCQEDTDHDGQTNGQELGDPCCSWVETGNLAYIRDVSDPADPTSRVNPIIFKGIQCTKSEEAVEAADKLAKKSKAPKKTATTAPPAASYWEYYASASGSGNASMRQESDAAPAAQNAARPLGGETASVAVAVGLAVAWAALL